MKLFKVFIGFWLLIGLVFVTSLFFPREFKVERSIVIDKPIFECFAYLNNIQNIAKLSPWDKSIDSTMHSFYSQQLNGRGASYYFTGNLLGYGSLKISESVTNEKICTQLDLNGHEMSASTTFLFKGMGYNKTQLTWTDYKDVGYNPIYRFLIPSKEKETTLQFDEGLMKIRIAIMSFN